MGWQDSNISFLDAPPRISNFHSPLRPTYGGAMAESTAPASLPPERPRLKRSNPSSGWVQFGKAAAVVTSSGSLGMLLGLLLLHNYWPPQNNAGDLIRVFVLAVASFVLVGLALVGVVNGIVATVTSPSWWTRVGLICCASSLIAAWVMFKSMKVGKPPPKTAAFTPAREGRIRTEERARRDEERKTEDEGRALALAQERARTIRSLLRPSAPLLLFLKLDPGSPSSVCDKAPTLPTGARHRIYPAATTAIGLADLKLEGQISASPEAEAIFELALEFRDAWINDPPSGTSQLRPVIALRLRAGLKAAGPNDRALQIRGIQETGVLIRTLPDATRRSLEARNAIFKWTPNATRPNHAQLEFEVDATDTRPALRYLIPILVTESKGGQAPSASGSRPNQVE